MHDLEISVADGPGNKLSGYLLCDEHTFAEAPHFSQHVGKVLAGLAPRIGHTVTAGTTSVRGHQAVGLFDKGDVLLRLGLASVAVRKVRGERHQQETHNQRCVLRAADAADLHHRWSLQNLLPRCTFSDVQHVSGVL